MRARYIVLALIALTACKNKEKEAALAEERANPSAAVEAPRETKPIDVEWIKEDKVQVKGSPDKYGEVSIFRGVYQITVYGFPKGTKWTALDKKGVIDSEVYNIIQIADMTEKLGDVPVDPDKQRAAKLDPNATLTLDQPDGGRATIKLPPSDLGLSVEEALKKIENGPVLFGKEPPDEKPMENVLYLEGLSPEVFGRASVLKDVDAIAKAELLPDVKGTKKCTGYTNNDGKAANDLDLQLKETQVIVFERRTGNVLQKKVFPPDNSCPMFAFRRADETAHDSSIPSDAIKAWLKTQIKR